MSVLTVPCTDWPASLKAAYGPTLHGASHRSKYISSSRMFEMDMKVKRAADVVAI